MYEEPGYHLHLSAFFHLPYSFLTLVFSFQNLLELYACLKVKGLDCSCLCHFSSSLTSIYCIWYSAVIQLFSLQLNTTYMQRNDLQAPLWGLHVYSHCDSYQISSTYNCKYIFIAASSAKTLSDLKANLCPFWFTHRSFRFCCFSAQFALFCFHLASFLYKSWSRQSLWRRDILTLVQHSREAVKKIM